MVYDIGMIGLAVMGENLVVNMAGRDIGVAVYNRTVAKVDKFVRERGRGLPIGGAHSLVQLVSMVCSPRKIMLMVKAGQPVDDMIDDLIPLLSPGDMIIDGGNSFFLDTRRRWEKLDKLGIGYIGMGVSGGEEGALHGPSLMPGGKAADYQKVAPLFTKIAAAVDGQPCCSYVGPDGAGHYVKMVHNGIEYGDMQLISEAYYIMKNVLAMSCDEMHDVFAQWNKGVLDSYLIEITRDIMKRVDEETGQPLVEVVLDKAGQKGTGKWTSQSALELGVPTPTITEAVFARCMSSYKAERVAAQSIIKGPERIFAGDKAAFITAVHDALYASKICSYAQGFALLKAASREYGWNLDFGKMALLWRGGCIIRAVFLDRIKEAFDRNQDLPNLLVDPFFYETLAGMTENWRLAVKTCKELGIATPAFSASLDYFDSYRQAVLPANLIQAQRDYFGAHTYERSDKSGVFHSDWTK